MIVSFERVICEKCQVKILYFNKRITILNVTFLCVLLCMHSKNEVERSVFSFTNTITVIHFFP